MKDGAQVDPKVQLQRFGDKIDDVDDINSSTQIFLSLILSVVSRRLRSLNVRFVRDDVKVPTCNGP